MTRDLYGFGRKTNEESAIFVTPFQGYTLSISLMTFHVKFDHLTEVVFLRFVY